MSCALLIDFGSTFTKLRAVDLGTCRIVAAAQATSTVTSDVNVGLDAALARMTAELGSLPRFQYRLASSSAAGGLRMATVGLVRELTAEAARQAALGAGAKLVGSFAYRLTAADMRRLEGLQPDLLLLCGGTDGGNSEVILHNAGVLAASRLECPIIVAGNREASDEVASRLVAAGKTVQAAENVMPEFNVLSIEPARKAIRELFMARIIHAKGIDRAQDKFDRVLMPTPAAVLEGAQLLAAGAGGHAGMGDLMVVDPGGATTDVHSIGKGDPTEPGVLPYGLPEPHAKRTVEGDLGMRYNAQTIVEVAGIERIAADAGLAVERAQALVARLVLEVGRLPQDEDDGALDRALAAAAVRIAVNRHAGRVETVYTGQGPVRVQRGKDLTRLKAVIGTGGAIVASPEPRSVLAAALADGSDPTSLAPRDAALWLDRDYLVYAAGLLAECEPAAAFALARSSLTILEEEKAYG
ncbi:MAG TPA: methylaspartate mutase accessory protein GlmL [Usitatibacter sp.]|nr:methylaspartate mutase accessory protein GlmL [Usitatibacter sp.]